MTQTTCTVFEALGTVNSNTAVIATRGADSSNQGRALPSRLRVWSIT